MKVVLPHVACVAIAHMPEVARWARVLPAAAVGPGRRRVASRSGGEHSGPAHRTGVGPLSTRSKSAGCPAPLLSERKCLRAIREPRYSSVEPCR